MSITQCAKLTRVKCDSSRLRVRGKHLAHY